MMLMVTLEAVFENTQVSTQLIRIRWSEQSGLRIASTKSESILQNPIFELTPEFEGTLKDEIRKHESHDNLSHDYNYFATTNENSISAKWFLKTKLFQKRLNVNKVIHKSLSVIFYEAINPLVIPLPTHFWLRANFCCTGNNEVFIGSTLNQAFGCFFSICIGDKLKMRNIQDF